jgi:Methyltransferase FkbM domain
LATELKKRHMTRIDYMTIDTEGSELEIVLDFNWNDFDVRVVQIEQLVEARYPAQKGKKDRIIQHMTSAKFGYKLLGVYDVAHLDTDDLIFTRNLDDYLSMTDYMRGTHPKMRAES